MLRQAGGIPEIKSLYEWNFFNQPNYEVVDWLCCPYNNHQAKREAQYPIINKKAKDTRTVLAQDTKIIRNRSKNPTVKTRERRKKHEQ